MNTKSLKKLALLGITSGLVLSAQTQISAEILNESNAGSFLAAQCGSGKCGSAPAQSSVGSRASNRASYTAEADLPARAPTYSTQGATGASGASGSATTTKLSWNQGRCNGSRPQEYSNQSNASYGSRPHEYSNQSNASYGSNSCNGSGQPQGYANYGYRSQQGSCNSQQGSYAGNQQQCYNQQQQSSGYNNGYNNNQAQSNNQNQISYTGSCKSQQEAPQGSNSYSRRDNARSYTADNESMPNQAIVNQANTDRALTESELFSKLSDTAKAQYKTLDVDGKAFALKTASQPSLINKDQAVQAAVARQNSLKKTSAVTGSQSNVNASNNIIPEPDTTGSMNQVKPSNW